MVGRATPSGRHLRVRGWLGEFGAQHHAHVRVAVGCEADMGDGHVAQRGDGVGAADPNGVDVRTTIMETAESLITTGAVPGS
ncbi:hypothetical protein [Candidatus Frankia nodulisporulans]|uniref:hypothetical protein n=1 Tax=Candidatus Frankia nodulisporulans TaxID=2060052 RepID=UPI0013D67B9E|nr:hypothetical protein [Candidatus Frankia nodulisporulans]